MVVRCEEGRVSRLRLSGGSGTECVHEEGHGGNFCLFGVKRSPFTKITSGLTERMSICPMFSKTFREGTMANLVF